MESSPPRRASVPSARQLLTPRFQSLLWCVLSVVVFFCTLVLAFGHAETAAARSPVTREM